MKTRLNRGQSDLPKKILCRIYLMETLEGNDFTSDLFNNVDLNKHLRNLENQGLLALRRPGKIPHLTEKGRKNIVVVMAGGSFDIIHPGHVETLEKAKSLGDVLVVSVARDSTILKNKKRSPLHNERLRKKLVEAIKPVDAAVLGSEIDIFETALRLKPDIIALGYDQSHDESSMKSELGKRGLTTKIVRLDSSVPDIKTSKIARDYY